MVFPDSEDYTFAAATITDWVAQHTADDLSPYTQYYAGLCLTQSQTDPVWIGDPIRFKSLADETVSGPVTFRWALGSCQRWEGQPSTEEPGSLGELAWADLLEFAPDVLWDIGDFHYQGGAEEKYGDDSDPLTWQQMYWDQIAALPTMRMLRARVVEDQLGDDHDFSKNDGESQYPWTGPAGSPYNRGFQRSIQMQAMQALFAMQQPVQASAGLYASYLLTPHVRVVLTDAESLQRAPGDAIHDAPASADEYDKIWTYPTWRQTFATAMQNATPPVELVWLGGDRHAVAYCSGPHNPVGGFPCLIGSGWSEHSLHPHDGEDYDYAWPWNSPDYDPAGPQWAVAQYVRGTLTDDMAGTITMTIEIRYLTLNSQIDTLPTGSPIVLCWHYIP